MTGDVQWSGLDEFKRFLRTLPESLARQAGPIVTDAATLAHGEIRLSYPRKSGRLQDRVRLEMNRDVYGATGTITSAAFYALWFERGTQARRTGKGADRGVMKPAPISFVDIAKKHRRAMYNRIGALLERNGFQVTIR